MNDCISLPAPQGTGGLRRLGGWEATWLPLGEGEAERLFEEDRGRNWRPVEVPAQQAAVDGRSAIWYRTHFAKPDHTGRVLLRFGGAFLAANVWLNGRFLGSHYGYFAPFGFDITPYLRPQNLLVVCCESPIEKDIVRKRHVMGFMADGDSRPYPSSAYFSLPDEYRWEVPVGLWRPVELEYVGPVLFDFVRFRPWLEGDVGRLELEAKIRNLDGREMSGEIALEVGRDDRPPIRLRRTFRVSGGLEQSVEMSVSIPEARRWSPWRFGEAILHPVSVDLVVDGQRSARLEESFGFRDVNLHAAHDAWELRINGRPAFIRGADYQPAYRLDSLTPERFRADIELAREANLDALRVHAHVLPEEFYREADRAGMLVVADLPLTGSYAYHATAEESAFFESSVRDMVPEAAALLRNRTSLMLWIAHDDPPWVAGGADLGDVHVVRQNYTVDQEARTQLERLDPGRTALAASGDMDAHANAGWSHGSWRDLADLAAPLVTEIGAQAAPDLESGVWKELGRLWPVADGEPAWLHAGFQPAAWAEFGAGLPSEFASLEDWVEAGQAYQAWLVRYGVEQMRKHKYEPCWGVFVYQLVDSIPGIGFGVLDASRRPKAAYAALRHAMAPTRLLIDPVGFDVGGARDLTYVAGRPVALRLVAVNDDPALGGVAAARWSVSRQSGPALTGAGRLRDAVRRKSYSGSLEFDLPDVSEPAVQVASISLPLEAPGRYRVEAELSVRGRSVDRADLEFDFLAQPAPARRRPVVPAYIAARLLAEDDAVRGEDHGFSVLLINRTRPAVLAAVGEIRVDGRLLAGARVLLESGTGRVPLPRRTDLPSGRPVRLHIDLGRPLEPGAHDLELDITVPGVAGGRLQIATII